MEAAWLHRACWRWRGAWLRPAFVALTVADAVIAIRLPAAGDSAPFAGMLILAGILNLVAALVLNLPLSWLIRRLRPQLPGVVARDHAGTLAVVLVTAGFLGLGLANRSSVSFDRASMRDAQQRALSWIASHAPAALGGPLARADTYAIQPGSVYRTCVHGAAAPRSYCVIVRRHMPSGRDVRFAGSEPNWLFAQGAN